MSVNASEIVLFHLHTFREIQNKLTGTSVMMPEEDTANFVSKKSFRVMTADLRSFAETLDIAFAIY